MDSYEATKIVFQRIQTLDPENVSKIMGVLLIQDHGDQEMIRLALGPEALLHSVILKARKDLCLASSNAPSTPSTPSPTSPFSSTLSLSRQNSCSSVSSRLLGGVNVNLPPPVSITNPSSTVLPPSWMKDNFITSASGGEVDLIDELNLQDQLSFLNDGKPSLGPKSSDFFYSQQQDLSPSLSRADAALFPPYAGWGDSASGNGLTHRRSFSVSDISDDLSGGFGWRTCLYYARGYCKNGTTCRFLHGEGGSSAVDADGGALAGSPSNFKIIEQCHELLRSKSAQQQKMANVAHLMASSNLPYFTFPPSKCMNLLMQQQLVSDNARFRRGRFDRGDFPFMNGAGMASPGSRQIYLTFPADSTFKEEDVSNYFSIFGPVQDVRIPYQQKRMFGFVTFEYPETVKLILAKGNPHFVCDARVLVKPYKEKGKIPEKYSGCRKQQQLMEKGEFMACGSPTGLECGDPFDLGARLFNNYQEMSLMRKFGEQADLQQNIELQNRRLMGMQLLDAERKAPYSPLYTGMGLSSPPFSPSLFSRNVFHQTQNDHDSMESQEGCNPNGASSIHADVPPARPMKPVNVGSIQADKCLSVKCESEKESPQTESHLQECSEHNLPDSPFASATAVSDYDEANNSHTIKNSVSGASMFPANPSLDMHPFKPCHFHMPRFASGHEAIGM